MTLAQSRWRWPNTVVVPPWSNPFFPPQKRRIASFLQVVNVGISSLPPSLIPLEQNNTTDKVLKVIADDGTRPSWSCPAVSPCSAGLECPVFLYGAKTVPPTRAERQQGPASRQQERAVGSGPNHPRSRRRLLRRNLPRLHPM